MLEPDPIEAQTAHLYPQSAPVSEVGALVYLAVPVLLHYKFLARVLLALVSLDLATVQFSD